jgi:hypothetical protein
MPALFAPGRLILSHVLLGDIHGVLKKVPAQSLGFKAISLAHPGQGVKTRLASKVMLSLDIQLRKSDPFLALWAADPLPTKSGSQAPDRPLASLPSANNGSLGLPGPPHPMPRGFPQERLNLSAFVINQTLKSVGSHLPGLDHSFAKRANLSAWQSQSYRHMVSAWHYHRHHALGAHARSMQKPIKLASTLVSGAININLTGRPEPNMLEIHRFHIPVPSRDPRN